MTPLFGIVALSIYLTLSKCENVAQSVDDVSIPIRVHTQRLTVDHDDTQDTSNWISIPSLFDTTLCTIPSFSNHNDSKVCIHSHWYLDNEPYTHLTVTANDEVFNFWNDTEWTTINAITSVHFEQSVSDSILSSLSDSAPFTPSPSSRRRLGGKCGWKCQDERRDRKERARWKRQNAVKDRMSKLLDREMRRRDEREQKRKNDLEDKMSDPMASLVNLPRKKLGPDELIQEREKWRRFYMRKIRRLRRRYEERRARAYRERRKEWLEHNDHLYNEIMGRIQQIRDSRKLAQKRGSGAAPAPPAVSPMMMNPMMGGMQMQMMQQQMQMQKQHMMQMMKMMMRMMHQQQVIHHLKAMHNGQYKLGMGLGLGMGLNPMMNGNGMGTNPMMNPMNKMNSNMVTPKVRKFMSSHSSSSSSSSSSEDGGSTKASKSGMTDAFKQWLMREKQRDQKEKEEAKKKEEAFKSKLKKNLKPKNKVPAVKPNKKVPAVKPKKKVVPKKTVKKKGPKKGVKPKVVKKSKETAKGVKAPKGSPGAKRPKTAKKKEEDDQGDEGEEKRGGEEGKDEDERRRLLGLFGDDDDVFKVSPDRIQKCAVTQGLWLCLEYDIDGDSVSVEFEPFSSIHGTPGYLETTEWVVPGDGAGIMCNDRLLSSTENAAICVENGESVHSERIHVVVQTEGDDMKLELNVQDEHDWDLVSDINGDLQRVCTQLSRDRLCVEYHRDNLTHGVQRVFVERVGMNAVP